MNRSYRNRRALKLSLAVFVVAGVPAANSNQRPSTMVEIISGDLTADRSSEQRKGLVDVDLVVLDIDEPVLVLQFMVHRAPHPVQGFTLPAAR